MNVWLHVAGYKRQFSLHSLCKSLKAQLFVYYATKEKNSHRLLSNIKEPHLGSSAEDSSSCCTLESQTRCEMKYKKYFIAEIQVII